MVSEGMDGGDEMACTDRDMRDRPRTPQVIKSVTAETFGVDYPEPKKNK